MTEKLYYQDQMLFEFTADIISINKEDEGYAVVLDQTAFYPEGGGQPADMGEIGGAEVSYVGYNGDTIVHYVTERPEGTSGVRCEVDREKRFDHMQQHTGQHILSAVLLQLYNAETIGFHLGNDYVSIDLDREIDQKRLTAAEDSANQTVYDDIEIKVLYPDRQELSKLNLRKDPSVDEDIRIVKIGDLDLSPCGGTHLSRTGQLGVIKIIESSNYKGGTRVIFQCGGRALKDYQFKNRIITDAREILSVKNDEIIKEIGRILDSAKEKDKMMSELKEQLIEFKTDDLIRNAEIRYGVRIINQIITDLEYKEARFIAAKATSHEDVIALIGHQDGDNARLVFSRSDNIEELEMDKIIKEPLAIIGGRGGGNKIQAQGGGSRVENLSKALIEAYNLVLKQLA